MFKWHMAEHLPSDEFTRILLTAVEKRKPLSADPETNAYRIFNGFYEGCPDISIDRYGSTAVILWTAKKRRPDPETLDLLCELCLKGI